MTTKKDLVIAVLATFCLTMTLFIVIPTRSASTTGTNPEYDPWCDLDDDGQITLYDAVRLLSIYGAKGMPINKTALLLELQSRMDDVNASLLGQLATLLELESRMDDVNASLLDLKVELLAFALQTDLDGLKLNVDDLNASVFDLLDRVGGLEQFGGSIYRWNVFDTFLDNYAWLCGNDASLYGGVRPSDWTNNGATAQQISSDKEVLRTLFCQKGYGGANALVYSNVFFQISSDTGRVVVCLFRIKNTMENDAITWYPCFRYTCYMGWSERASVALNGVNQWTSDSGDGLAIANVSLSIPPNRTSTVIFVSTSSQSRFTSGSYYVREVVLAFCNNSLALPTGLKFVDDLDTATGGWDR